MTDKATITQAEAISLARQEAPDGAIHVMGAPEEATSFTTCQRTVGDAPVIFHVNIQQVMPGLQVCLDCGHQCGGMLG